MSRQYHTKNELLAAIDEIINVTGLGTEVVMPLADFVAAKDTPIHLMGRTIYIPAGLTYLNDNITVIGPGEIKFQDDTSVLRLGNNNVFRNVTFTGTLTTNKQFILANNGVTSYFASPTYQDAAAGTVDGSDFTHTLAGDILTVSLLTLTNGAGIGRYVVSSTIPLSTSKKYAIYIEEGFNAGDGIAPIQIWVCDSNGNELTQYDPSSDTGSFTILENPAALKIKVGSAKHDHTKLNLSGTFDLSKIKIYELTDYAATLTNSSTPVENLTHIGVYKDNCIIEGCTFKLSKFAALKFVGGKNNVFGTNNKIIDSLGGVTTQTGYNNTIVGNYINLDLKDTAGNTVPSGIFIRNHNVNLAGTENSSKVYRNTCIGASWAIEHPDSGTTGYSTEIVGNSINCVHTGISSMIAYSVIQDNSIRLSSIGLYGIEIGSTPQIGEIVVQGNTVFQRSPATISYGIAASRYLMNSCIVGNTLRAAIGIQISAPGTTVSDQKITVLGNNIRYFVKGIYNAAGGTRVEFNQILCYGRYSNNLSQTAGIENESVFNTTYFRNNLVDGAGSYCVKITNPQSVEFSRNVFNSFTGNYCDCFISSNAAYAAYPKFRNNRIFNKAGNAFASSGSWHASSKWFLCENYSETADTQNLLLTVTGIAASSIVLEERQGQMLTIYDGITAPSATSGYTKIYTDAADGDLKVIFGDGQIKTITTDTP